MRLTDPVALAAALVRVPSVTPDDGNALGLVTDWLTALGACCDRFEAEGTSYRVGNLVATWNGDSPLLAFNGHTDVVPPGDAADWQHAPFAGTIADGKLWGRGACDMKGAIAAWIAAIARRQERGAKGRLQVLITGDEEGESVAGTKAIVQRLQDDGPVPKACIVGEPTSAEQVGDRIKVGRRGSLNAVITVPGIQGHTAYPSRADNPIHRLVAAIGDLTATPLDQGTEAFEPSSLQVTSVDVGNPASNVIPARAEARLNIRFNTHHSGPALERWLIDRVAHHAPLAEVTCRHSGEAFFVREPWFADLVVDAVQEHTGEAPERDTGGGTSDARFIKDLCPVVELGSVGHSLHQTDEYVALAELETLTELYGAVIDRFFREAAC